MTTTAFEYPILLDWQRYAALMEQSGNLVLTNALVCPFTKSPADPRTFAMELRVAQQPDGWNPDPSGKLMVGDLFEGLIAYQVGDAPVVQQAVVVSTSETALGSEYLASCADSFAAQTGIEVEMATYALFNLFAPLRDPDRRVCRCQ